MPETHHFRLPRTPDRGKDGYLKLLTAVDIYAPPGLQMQGQLLTPGAHFDPADLPCPAVLIENAGSCRIAKARSRYSFAQLWLLWRFDTATLEWVEVARTHATDASWTFHFAPLAERLLHPAGAVPAEERARPVCEQLAAAIAAELRSVSREVSCYVLAGLQEHVATEIVRRTAPVSVLKVGYGKGAVYPLLGADPNAGPGVLKPRISAA